MNANQFLTIFIVLLFSLCGCGRKVNNLSENKDTIATNKDTSTIKQISSNDTVNSGYYKSKLSFDEYIKQHSNLSRQIEFNDLLELLAVDKSAGTNNESFQKWTILSDNNSSPVNWYRKLTNSYKVGEVILKFDNKPAEIRDEKIIRIIWTLTLIGDTLLSLLKKKNIKSEVIKSTGDPPRTGEHTTIDLIDGEKDLKISVPNKEPMWIIYKWSCQTDGCTANFVIYYNENKYKVESKNPKG